MLLLGLLALREVHVTTEHPIRLADGVPHHGGPRQNPAVGTIPVPHAEFVLKTRPWIVEVGAKSGQRSGHIVRVDALLPFAKTIGDLVVLIAQLALPDG